MKINKIIIIFLVWSALFIAQTHASNKIEGVRVWPSPESTRVVFDLSSKPDYSYFMLKNPYRLVVDFSDTDKLPSLPEVPDEHRIIKKLRYSSPKSTGGSRVVFDLSRTAKPVVFALAPTGPYKDRLVVDLYGTQMSAYSNESTNKKSESREKDRNIVIAIDAGHGGEDPGSIGPSGTYEKNITLQIAKRLVRLIDNEPGMEAKLIRTGDYFLKLNTRTVRARERKADFFVSIHADAFTRPEPSGSSVWVLSLNRANSEIGKWLENTEKHSQLLGGAADVIKDTENERYLAKALLDMSMDHSMKTGFQVAEEVIGELRKVTKLHKRTPQAANLGVLKSPDIPSILVETGFISNPTEERMLLSSSHQDKLARAVFNAIKGYYWQNPPADSLFASMRDDNPVKHTVKAGESLSVLASRYKVSVESLKRFNSLKSNTLFVGQVLTIPKA
ncbi:N-acetylmuramoyl-L-alanine amidase [Pseudoalteromonas xiamenensis]|uniref:N-acetylmuramoyl-L-alanine amidase n=1 Tax=Pseudoalteromonas xiamenensis TaxID=882626 RepID=UPI0035E9EBDC